MILQIMIENPEGIIDEEGVWLITVLRSTRFWILIPEMILCFFGKGIR
jgi:hypothetical protein